MSFQLLRFYCKCTRFILLFYRKYMDGRKLKWTNTQMRERERQRIQNRGGYTNFPFLRWISASNWSRLLKRDVQQRWKNGWKPAEEWEEEQKKSERKLTVVVQWKCIYSQKDVMFIRRGEKKTSIAIQYALADQLSNTRRKDKAGWKSFVCRFI